MNTPYLNEKFTIKFFIYKSDTNIKKANKYLIQVIAPPR